MACTASLLNLGPFFDHQHEVSHSAQYHANAAPCARDECFFGNDCPTDVLVAIFERLAVVSLKDFKLLSLVCRNWGYSISLARIRLATESIYFNPEFCLVNPSLNLEKVYDAAHTKKNWKVFGDGLFVYSDDLIQNEARRLFESTHVHVEVEGDDLALLDPDLVAHYNKHWQRIKLPQRFHYSQVSYINSCRDTEILPRVTIHDYGEVFKRLIELKLMNPSSLQPVIISDQRFSECIDHVSNFIQLCSTLFGVQPAHWKIDMRPWMIENADGINQNWYSHNPFFPTRESSHLSISEFCNAIRSLSIPCCKKLDIYLTPCEMFGPRFSRVTTEYPDFFYRILITGPVPIMHNAKEIRFLLRTFGCPKKVYKGSTNWPTIVRYLQDSLLEGVFTAKMATIRSHFPNLKKIVYATKWGPAPHTYTFDDSRGVATTLAVQLWDPPNRRFLMQRGQDGCIQ